MLKDRISCACKMTRTMAFFYMLEYIVGEGIDVISNLFRDSPSIQKRSTKQGLGGGESTVVFTDKVVIVGRKAKVQHGRCARSPMALDRTLEWFAWSSSLRGTCPFKAAALACLGTRSCGGIGLDLMLCLFPSSTSCV